MQTKTIGGYKNKILDKNLMFLKSNCFLLREFHDRRTLSSLALDKHLDLQSSN